MKKIHILPCAIALCITLTNVFGRPAIHHFSCNEGADSTTVVEVDTVVAKPDTVWSEYPDSNLSVIAWFDKRDTMTYWINESSWIVKGEDSTKTSGLSANVMISVLDSTRKGYRMEYKFLDFQYDTIENQELNDLQMRITRLISDRIKGSSIIFRTNEYGQITKYENLKEIKKNAKDIYSSAYEELLKVPVFDSLKSVGIDLASIVAKVPGEAIIDGYTEDLELMFACHGHYYKLGDYKEHTDASDNEYESDTDFHITMNEDTWDYEISSGVKTIIPSKDLKTLVTGFMSSISDKELIEKFDEEYDKEVIEDAVSEKWVYCGFFADGWPQEIIDQSSFMLNGEGKLKQKWIVWDYRSVANH